MGKSWLIIAVLFLIYVSMARAEITLEGPFYTAYNLGDRLSLSASISHPNSINGFLKASLACDDKSIDYYLIPIELSPGIAKKIMISELLIQQGMTGDCIVSLDLLNNARQSIEKSQSGKLLISDKLSLDAKLSKQNINPGEKISVTGSVRNIRGEKLNEGDVRLVLEKETFIKVKDGEFGYEFNLPGDYKSGNHGLVLSVTDGSGNNIEKNFSFNVEAIAKKLEAKLSQDGFKPGEDVVIQALLYDQAGDSMAGNALIKVYDPSEKLASQRTISAGEEMDFSLPGYALPGDWKIIMSADGLEDSKVFNVGIIEELDFIIDQQKVVVTNIGNIDYRKAIELLLGSNSVKKETFLKPGETAIIDLSKEDVPSGSYSVEVAGGSNRKKFDNVEVEHNGLNLGESLGAMLPGTGNAILGTGDDPIVNPYYAGLAGAASLVAGYGGFRHYRRRKKYSEKTWTLQAKEAEKMAVQLRAMKEKQPYKHMSESNKEKQLIEYRDRILADIVKEKKAIEIRDMKMRMDTGKNNVVAKEENNNWFTPKKEDFSSGNLEKKEEEEDFTIKDKKKKDDEGNDGFVNLFGQD